MTHWIFHHPSPNEFVIILSCIGCGSFIRFDIGTDIEITHEGITSINKSCFSIKAINIIKINGDINMINSSINDFSSTKFQPNDILFHKVIKMKKMKYLLYIL
jgi:hypothetical protein